MRAALAVNRELVQLYWSIGRDIVIRQDREGWGSGVIDRLSADIRAAFPGIEGFSNSNISRMRAFYRAWVETTKISAHPVPELTRRNSAQAAPKIPDMVPPHVVTELPWGHNVVLLFKVEGRDERLWYAQQAVKNGWSRNVLVHWIESDLYSRQGKAITNFKTSLPPAQSESGRGIRKRDTRTSAARASMPWRRIRERTVDAA